MKSLAQPFVLIWAGLILWVALSLIVSFGSVAFWLLLLVNGGLLLRAWLDSRQSKHSILRNFPLVGHARYLFEKFRPEFRQYFFESDTDGKPFSRRQRSLVYQRAKNVKQTAAFGMLEDPKKPGYEWLAHSVYPKRVQAEQLRVQIGGPACAQPYSASLLNISAMSFGALSKNAVMALNEGAALGGFAHNTGEGGISDYHLMGGDLIWQIGTGYFGCRDDQGRFLPEAFAEKAALPAVKMIELKLSQGAKPGHGGLLPAHKNTPEIARIRQIAPYTAVHSPAAHSSFSDAEGLVYFIDRLRKLSGGKPVGFKLSIGRPEEFEAIVQQMVLTGIYPDFITIDGAEGGTGAAPVEFMDHMGMPLSDALPLVDKLLSDYGIRQAIKIMASGKIVSAFDMARVLALGADLCYSARGMMFALGCIQALQCDSDTCPVGVATQNPSLYRGLDPKEKRVRVAHFHTNTLKALAEILGAAGFDSAANVDRRSFYRRIDQNQYKRFDELYPVQPKRRSDSSETASVTL